MLPDPGRPTGSLADRNGVRQRRRLEEEGVAAGGEPVRIIHTLISPVGTRINAGEHNTRFAWNCGAK